MNYRIQIIALTDAEVSAVIRAVEERISSINRILRDKANDIRQSNTEADRKNHQKVYDNWNAELTLCESARRNLDNTFSKMYNKR